MEGACREPRWKVDVPEPVNKPTHSRESQCAQRPLKVGISQLTIHITEAICAGQLPFDISSPTPVIGGKRARRQVIPFQRFNGGDAAASCRDK